MKKKSRTLIVARWALSLLLPLTSGALELALPTESDPGPGPDSENRPSLDGPFPNVVLPRQVVAEFGKLSLFADHGHADDRGVPLYIVNRGTRDFPWSTYAGDPGIVLERYDEAAEGWQRAQAGMITFAMCGHSFATLNLKPGQHFKILGYRPKQGTEGRVRFHLDDHDLISNEGDGLWSEDDVAKVGLDRTQLSGHPFTEELQHWNLKGEDPGRKSVEQVLAELTLMQVWENGPVFRSFAKAFKVELERHATEGVPPDAEAIERVDSLLAVRQVIRANPDALFQRCLEILRSPRGRIYGSPEKEQEVAWIALGWLQRQPGFGQHERWRAAYDLLQSRLPEAEERELLDMRCLLRGSPMVHEFLTRDFLIQSARNYPALAGVCVERLASREDWHGLLSVAEGGDLEARLMVLNSFCLDPRADSNSPRLRTTYDHRQLEFWKGCLRDGPWQSVETMGRALRVFDGYYLEPGWSLALKDQAQAFADKAKQEPWPDDGGKFRGGLRQYVKILGRGTTSKNRFLHVFRELGDIRPEGETDEQHARRLEIAREARRQLLIAGWNPAEKHPGE